MIKLKASALMPETTLISPEMMVTVNLPTPILHRCCSCCYSANQKEKKKGRAEVNAQLKMKMMVMLGDEEGRAEKRKRKRNKKESHAKKGRSHVQEKEERLLPKSKFN